MRVLMTGAGGFIGSTLTRALLQAGELKTRDGLVARIDEILLVDTHLPDYNDSRITALNGDIAAPTTLAAIRQFKPDSVFHLAAVLTSEAERNPAHAMAVNVSALLSLIESRWLRHIALQVYLPEFDCSVRRLIA